MPTTRTRTVKASGGDYTSLTAWEAGEQADLVAIDEIRQAECYAFADMGSETTIEGWITDATRYVRVYTPATERHAGKWDDTKYHRAALRLRAHFTRVEGLQLQNRVDDNNLRGIQVQDAFAEFCRISHCIARLNPSFRPYTFGGGATGYHFGTDLNANQFIWNCIAYDFDLSNNAGIRTVNHFNGTKTYAYNITLVNCATGILDGFGDIVAKNCLAQDCADGFSGLDVTSDSNCSDIASDAPGTNPVTGDVAFVDAANKDFHLASGDTVAKNAGADLSADPTLPITTDIDGQARPAAEPTPTVAGFVGGNTGGNTTTHTISLPTSVAAGDLLLALICTDGNPTLTWPAGWTELFTPQSNGGVMRLEARYRVADGTEGASIAVTSSASEGSAWQAYRLTGWHGTTAPVAAATNGSSTNPNPPARTAPWGAEQSLWLALAGNDGDVAITAGPTNYTDFQNDRWANSNGSGIASARRALAALSEDPGVFTMTSEQWGAATIAVRPVSRWDIGADEHVAAAGASIAPHALAYARARAA